MRTRLRVLGVLAALPVLAVHARGGLPEFAVTLVTLDTMVAGDTARVVFRYRNRTADTLVAGPGQSSCGCLVLRDTLHACAPGDTGSVTATVVAEAVRRNPLELNVSFHPVRDSTGEHAETVLLTVVAPVRREMRFVPEVLGTYQPDIRTAAAIPGALRNESSTAVSVKQLALDTPTVMDLLTRQLPCTLGPGEQLPFVVVLQPGSAPAAVNGVQTRLRARTSGTRYAEHACDIYLFLE